jgi:hypothetical protein
MLVLKARLFVSGQEEDRMDAKRLVIGTLVGGITMYVVGYLIFEVMFAAFYAANAGSATGVARDVNLEWAVALGTLAYAALVTFAMGNQSGPSTIAAGIKTGAVVGFLLWFTADFIFYGITNVANLTRAIADPLLELVRGGIGGGVIAASLGKLVQSERRELARV